MLESGLLKKITTATSIMGLMVVGTMICKFVTVKVPLTLSFGQAVVEVGPTLDKIVPKLVPFVVSILTWRQLAKGRSMLRVLFTLALSGFVLGYLGVLG
jgi:mannose/fructose/N-acetylgalactosamine-specific phosphotransferase system component IID